MIDPDVMEMLSAFRALDKNEDAIPVLGDEQAMRVLVAWNRTDQNWVRPKAPAPAVKHGSHGLAWAWIRSGWRIDIKPIAISAGVSDRIARLKVDMLLGLRLIYPDGMMATGAVTALNVHVSQKLGVKQKPQATKPAGKKPDKPSGSENSNN